MYIKLPVNIIFGNTAVICFSLYAGLCLWLKVLKFALVVYMINLSQIYFYLNWDILNKFLSFNTCNL